MDRRVLTVLLVFVSLVAIFLIVQLYHDNSARDLSISPTANPTIVKNATDAMANLTTSETAVSDNSSPENMEMNNSTLKANTTEQPSQAMPQDGPGGAPPEGFNGAPPDGGTPPGGMPSGGAPPDGAGRAPPSGVSPMPSSTATSSTKTSTSSPSISQAGLDGGTKATSTDFTSWMPTVKPINMSKFLNISGGK